MPSRPLRLFNGTMRPRGTAVWLRFVGLLFDHGRVNAFAVVADLKRHAVGLLRGLNRQLAGWRLACRDADFRHLQSVIQAVADDMHARMSSSGIQAC